MSISLLAPAGSWASLVSAINSGADEVYFGTTLLNMRATAKNFELNQLKKIVDKCHENNVKANLTLNTIIYENESVDVYKVLEYAKKAGIDGIIAWDPLVLQAAATFDLPLHISTQASISNYESCIFYEKLGAEVVVLARELSLEKIKSIKEKLVKNGSKLKVECFAHGAMCVAISGRCFLSHFFDEKSANRGECYQPCRRSYKAVDESSGKELHVENHTIFSPKDLCTIPVLDKLIESGIDVLKIEGRNRSPDYVMVVISAYRKAIDEYYKGNLTETLKNELVETLKGIYNKGFHDGFYTNIPKVEDFSKVENSASNRKKEYVGIVSKVFKKIGVFELVVHSKTLNTGDTILVIGKSTGASEAKIISIHDQDRKSVESTCRGEIVGIKVDSDLKIRPKSKVFRFEK
jgi:U32 family peptidase